MRKFKIAPTIDGAGCDDRQPTSGPGGPTRDARALADRNDLYGQPAQRGFVLVEATPRAPTMHLEDADVEMRWRLARRRMPRP